MRILTRWVPDIRGSRPEALVRFLKVRIEGNCTLVNWDYSMKNSAFLERPSEGGFGDGVCGTYNGVLIDGARLEQEHRSRRDAVPV